MEEVCSLLIIFLFLFAIMQEIVRAVASANNVALELKKMFLRIQSSKLSRAFSSKVSKSYGNQRNDFKDKVT